MDDEVKAAIERLGENAGWSNNYEDVELICNALERTRKELAASKAAHSRCADQCREAVRELRVTIASQAATIDAMSYAAGPHYRLHDGKSLSEVYLPTLLELLLEQTQATINDLRWITALGIGGCHDVKTDSDAWVRIERIESR